MADDLAVEHVDGAIGHVCVIRIVGNHADGGAILVQIAQQFHYLLAVVRIEVTCRLIRATATRCC